MTKLTAEKRTKVSKAENTALRGAGKIPAVVYGKKYDATPIAIDGKDFAKVFKEAGSTTVVEVAGLGEDVDVLIQEVTADPVLGHPIHIDLYAVDSKTAVQVEVPIEFVGEAPAEKELGGILIKVMHELSVEALPKDLPHEITVSIDGLKTYDDQVHVSDIIAPAGVTILAEPEEVVALVQEAVEEDLSAEVEGPDMESIGAAEERGKQEEAEGTDEAA